MPAPMNRRSWLKTSTLLTGGLPLLSGVFSGLNLSAAPVAAPAHVMSEYEALETTPPEIMARLSANENPFGPSPMAKKALSEAIDNSCRYGFSFSQQLAEKISKQEGIDKNMIGLSAGSSPFLLAGAIHFAKDGGSVISADPSYNDMPAKAESLGAKWVKIPLTSTYHIDLDAMEKAIDNTTKVVYICNPNNPTATALDTAKLKAFCERVSKKVPVYIDEAYIDYLPDPQAASMIDCIKKGQNVIVIRTFSKLYGFAGLRIGYMVAQPDMLKKIGQYCSGGMAISSTSGVAAVAAYDDKEFLKSALQKTIASRDYLYNTLKTQGYEAIPSSANFAMFPIKMEGRRFSEEMNKRGVGVRSWKFAGKDWCRVSIGTMEEMKAFETAFKDIA
jgi:histidinol-phosphate aminotransferase